VPKARPPALTFLTIGVFCHDCHDQTSLIGRVLSADESFAARQLLPSPLSGEHTLRVAKPWKCRLRLHDWEDRKNPETHAQYQVCVRCNAYSDTGGARPDGGAAASSGFVIGGP
jgi:hypothetical protein